LRLPTLGSSSSLRRLSRPPDDDIVGPAGCEPGDDILCRFAPKLDFGLHAEEGGVWRQDQFRVAEQGIALRNRFDRQDVQRGAGKYSTIECRKQIAYRDDRSPRRVDEV